MKTLLKVFGSAAIAFAVSCPAQAYDFSVDGLLFNIIDTPEGETATIIGTDDKGNPILAQYAEVTYNPEKHDAQLGSYSGEVKIPTEVSYNGDTYMVIAIGQEAFRYCDALTSITEGYTIRYVRDYAFADCSITDCSLIASDSNMTQLKEIGEYAFAKSGIKKIRLCNTVRIGQYAFTASAVEEIWFYTYGSDGEYFYIPDSCFKDCTSLSNVYGSDIVSSVDTSAFENCTRLNSILSSQHIDENAYKGCTGLTILEIPSKTTYISDLAFQNCKNISKVIVEKSNDILEIPEGMQLFKGCNQIKEIEIGRQIVADAETREVCNPFEGLTAERLVFRNWGLTLPMTSASFPNLTSIECQTAIPPQIGTLSAHQYATIAVTVPASALQSYQNSPYWEDFDNLNASSDIATSGPIEYNGLYFNYGQVVRNPFGFYKGSFEIPAAVEIDGESYDVFTIDNEAFFNCTDVKKVTFAAGSKVSFIGNFAFAWSGIETIELPASGTDLSFGECSFWNCQNLTEVKLPETTRQIGPDMFKECPKLSKINFPANISTIKEFAFYRCASLTDVDLSGCTNVSKIERSAFETCNISSLKLPTSQNHISIGKYAFSGNKITDMVIPKGYEIEEQAFSINPISNITFGDEVMVDEKGSITADARIKTLTIEGRLPTKPNYDPYAPTYPCNWLGAASVDKIVFLQDCYDPDWNWPTWNVKEIEMHMAYYAPTIGDYFTEEQYRDIIVSVPESAYELYRNAPVWSKFQNLRGVDFAGIESVRNEAMDIRGGNGCITISNAKAETAITVYTIDGKCVAGRKTSDGGSVEIPLQKGIYIVNIAGDRTHKISVK